LICGASGQQYLEKKAANVEIDGFRPAVLPLHLTKIPYLGRILAGQRESAVYTQLANRANEEFYKCPVNLQGRTQAAFGASCDRCQHGSSRAERLSG
jgi:hypothetical protein